MGRSVIFLITLSVVFLALIISACAAFFSAGPRIGIHGHYATPTHDASGPAFDVMQRISAGLFTMGTDDANGMPNERPASVSISAFWMDEHDVTERGISKIR